MRIVILEFKLFNLHNPWHTQKEISIETELKGEEQPFKTKASWGLGASSPEVHSRDDITNKANCT